MQNNNKKKIFYIFHGRFPSEKAASLFAAKSCEALANQGVELTLLVPRRLRRSKSDLFEYYQIKKNFNVVFLPTIDLFSVFFVKKIAFFVSFILFSVISFVYLLVKVNRRNIIYSNETLPLILASLAFSNTFYEVHDFPETKFFFNRVLFKRLKWLLSTNKWKKQKLQEVFDLSPRKIIYEPNAVEVSNFNIKITKSEARKQLNLPEMTKIVVYTGHLYSWKGVSTLAEATKKISNVLVFFVGGTDKDVREFKHRYGYIKNIRIVGHRTHSEMPIWQKAADVLVLPNTAKEDISKFYTSPMKLFEYMASGTPIVASRITSILEILNRGNSELSIPDNPASFAKKINCVIKNTSKSSSLSKQALSDVKKYSWDKRAKRIIKFIGI